MRAIQQPIQAWLKGILWCRIGMSESPQQEPDHAIHHGQCSILTSRKHKIAEGVFMSNMRINKSLINAFITATNDNGPCSLSPALRYLLPKWLARRAHQNYRRVVVTVISAGLLGIGNRLGQGLNKHHHAWPAPIRAIINSTMHISGIVARIPAFQRPSFLLPCAAANPILGQSGEKIWE